VAKVREIEVASIGAYVEEVEALLPNTSLAAADRKLEGNSYRGVGLARTHKLRPGLYRHPTVTSIADLLKLERTMLEDFRRQSVLHHEMSSSQDDFMLLFVMQHHGIPTRLLDWTTNPFISLYFALSSAVTAAAGGKGPKEDAAVWVLDPVAWNEAALRQVSYGDGGPLAHEQATEHEYGPKKIIAGKLQPNATEYMRDAPAAILGIANNARMLAQRGVFTVFGRNVASMEDQVTKDFQQNTLTKLLIPKTVISELFTTLIRLGFTDSVSFPDFHGLAMEIRRARGFGV